MKRTTLLTCLLAVLPVLALSTMGAAASPAPAAGASYYFGFETTTKPWASASDAGIKSLSFDRVKGDNGCPDLYGNTYAALRWLTDAPTTKAPLPVGSWIVADFPAIDRTLVTVEWSARSSKDCAGCMPMVYVGAEAPTSSSQFSDYKLPLLKTEWQNYSYSTVMVGDAAAFVAIGWKGPSGELGVDCVHVSTFPLGTGPTGNQ